MVVFTTGSVVLVPFPFSDLSQSKLRPALALANVGRDDWILCQITSNPYSDPIAVELSSIDFQSGGLRTVSYARPGKLFTANQSLIVAQVGQLETVSLERVVDAITDLLRSRLR